MLTWAQFAAAAPEIAAVGLDLLDKYHIAYLATVRKDGAPRVHPVSPFVIQGRLFVATKPSSPKAYDQLRDGRYVLHMLPGENDDEFLIRGHSVSITGAATRAMILKEGPHWVKSDDYIFEYLIESAATTFWENVGQPGTRPIRRHWQEDRTL